MFTSTLRPTKKWTRQKQLLRLFCLESLLFCHYVVHNLESFVVPLTMIRKIHQNNRNKTETCLEGWTWGSGGYTFHWRPYWRDTHITGDMCTGIHSSLWHRESNPWLRSPSAIKPAFSRSIRRRLMKGRSRLGCQGSEPHWAPEGCQLLGGSVGMLRPGKCLKFRCSETEFGTFWLFWNRTKSVVTYR